MNPAYPLLATSARRARIIGALSGVVNRKRALPGMLAPTNHDHFDELIGATELFIYQTPNRRAKGFDALKLFWGHNRNFLHSFFKPMYR